MILGTAGHIDHGKTALVRALTGVETDRLPEERRRGITIALGFAPLRLDGLPPIGVVDVPGHEAFVRTMLAGASGIDVALLVVAADEGVKPQTREHLEIVRLLAVPRLVVALTKRDLVDVTRAAEVDAAVRTLLASTPYAEAEHCEVSSVTGEGVEALRAALARAAHTVPGRTDADPWRLPVDRVFSVRGAGTVVTGTAWSGRLAREAAVRLLPTGREARVRTIEMHGTAAEEARGGARVALALAGLAREEVPLDAVLVRADELWETTRVLRADVALVQGADPVGPRHRLRFHVGTADVGARCVALGGPLVGGEARAVRIVLDAPVVLRAGDRFVLRGGARIGTLGGGCVTDPLPTSARARPWPHAGATDAERLGWMLDEAAASGLALAPLPQRLGRRPAEAQRLVRALERVVELDGRLLRAEHLDGARQRLLSIVDAAHAANPLAPGCDRQTARVALRVAPGVADEVIRRAERAGVLVGEGPWLRRPSHRPAEDAGIRSRRDAVRGRLDAAGTTPPSRTELVTEFGKDVIGILRQLEQERAVIAIAMDWWFSIGAIRDLLARLGAFVRPGIRYAPSELREPLGITRKWLIPFLEWCDRRGISRREGDGRVFREVPAEP